MKLDTRGATLAYTAPFLTFVAAMAIEKSVGLTAQVFYPLRFTLSCIAVLLFSWHVVRFRPREWFGSVLVGAAVFVIWIAPDLLFGYRHHWLFDNSVTGRVASSISAGLRHNPAFVVLRVVGCTLLVPIIEELFWRGWLMRWLTAKEFTKVPYEYAPGAFWLVVLLFASEHGPYWEVGAIAGAIYNWWAIRTKNLADCIWAHAVTNGMLSAYVLATGRWEYLL